jgi:hypothetical protein
MSEHLAASPRLSRSPAQPAAIAAAAAALTVIACTSVAGLHQLGGVLLVLLFAATVYLLVQRLFPALEAVPATALAVIAGLSLMALLVVAVAATGVRVTPVAMSTMIGVAAATLGVAGWAAGWRPDPEARAARSRPSRRHLATAAVGLAVVVAAAGAGEVTARLSPQAHSAPYTAMSFGGAAASWSAPVQVRPGQVLAVPLQIVNESGRAQDFVLDAQVGSRRTPLESVSVAGSASWSGTARVALPGTGCPARVSIVARSADSTNSLDVWLQWSGTSCR